MAPPLEGTPDRFAFAGTGDKDIAVRECYEYLPPNLVRLNHHLLVLARLMLRRLRGGFRALGREISSGIAGCARAITHRGWPTGEEHVPGRECGPGRG